MIRCEGLVVQRGGRPVVEIDHLELGCGLVALMGPNGAGKTTLLETLAGRLPFEGTLEVPACWLVAAEPPNRVLVQARDVVASHAARDPDAWLERVGYSGPTSLAHGSSGERMLVALAGALARQSEMLLLDEPFGHLDPPHVSRLTPLLATRASHDGVLFTTHDPAVAAQADRVLLLDRTMVADGPPEEVLQPEPLSQCFGASIQVAWTELGPVIRGKPGD